MLVLGLWAYFPSYCYFYIIQSKRTRIIRKVFVQHPQTLKGILFWRVNRVPKPNHSSEFAIPDAWWPALQRLQPNLSKPVALPLPSLGTLVDACLKAVPLERRTLIWERFGKELTLNELSQNHNLAREKAQQLISSTIKEWRQEAQLMQVLLGVFNGLNRADAQIIDISKARSTVIIEAPAAELWNFLIQVWREVLNRPVRSLEIARNTFLYISATLPTAADLKKVMLKQANFLSAGALAGRLGISVEAMRVVAYAYPQLVLTAGGEYGYLGWSGPALLKAIAEQFANIEVNEWHVSQLSKAVAVFNPAWASTHASSIPTLLEQHPNWFEFVGRKGYWRLTPAADGHSDHRSAVRAVLAAAPLPLHWSEIKQQLQRSISQDIIVGILESSTEFERFGPGIFGQRTRLYTELKNLSEEAFILELFAKACSSTLPVQQVLEEAKACGFDPQRLMMLGRKSEHFCYWKSGNGEALFVTNEEANIRYFELWAIQKNVRDFPEKVVLQDGLRAAYGRQDKLTIRSTYEFMQQRGVTFPEQFRHYLDWALS